MLTAREKSALQKYISDSDDRLHVLFDALGEQNRCNMFRLFIKNTNLNVGEVAELLDITVPLASQHLKMLEGLAVLERRKIGREVFYKINEQDPVVQSLIRSILEVHIN
ncbi:MAG TPA: metalloregulator ArsR/SmtB family transcription factor [Candidatus Saccharimonadales bacterium]|nr:metalloregulator ArsR/SmtB family transcription factor [Candidatus Saccharimonadales bacterium]